MSSADLLEDGFPHGTIVGYRRGCHGTGACPNSALPTVMTCVEANTRYASDYGYRRHIDGGGTWLSPAAVGAETQESTVPKPRPRPGKRRDAVTVDDELRARLAAPDFPHGTVEGFALGCVVTSMCPADVDGRTCVQARQEQLSDHERRRRGDTADPTAPKEPTVTIVDQEPVQTYATYELEEAARIADGAPVDTDTPARATDTPAPITDTPAPETVDDSAGGDGATEKTVVGAALEDALHEKMSHDERWRHYNKGCRHPLCYEAKKERAAAIAAGTITPKRKAKDAPVIDVTSDVDAPQATTPDDDVRDQLAAANELLRLATEDVTRLEEVRHDHLKEIAQLQGAVRLHEKTIDKLTGELLTLTSSSAATPTPPDVGPLTRATGNLSAAIAQLSEIASLPPAPELTAGTSGVALVLTAEEAAAVIHALATSRP